MCGPALRAVEVRGFRYLTRQVQAPKNKGCKLAFAALVFQAPRWWGTAINAFRLLA